MRPIPPFFGGDLLYRTSDRQKKTLGGKERTRTKKGNVTVRSRVGLFNRFKKSPIKFRGGERSVDHGGVVGCLLAVGVET